MCAQLELQLLESPLIRWKGRELRPPSSRTLPLIAYVALKQGPTSRRELVQLLWEDALLVNLRQELAKIRAMPGASEWLKADASSGRVEVRATSDMHRLRAALRDEVPSYIVEKFTGLGNLDLLTGLELDFLPPPFQEWLEQENSELELALIDALHSHASEQEQAGDLGGAIATYHQLLRIDAFAESAHRAVMRLEVAAGRPEAAAQQLDRARHIFRREFEFEPSPETLAMAPALRTAALPAQGAPRRVRAFPVAKTPFVGRTRELAELDHLFHAPGTRIVSVIGLGGVGKSRLALEFSHGFRDQVADGVVYVPLANSERVDLVPASLATILGLPSDGDDCRELVLQHLESKQYFLLFDNVEHLSGAPELISEIADRSLASRIMITSQVPLGLQLERTYWLQGLSLPPPDDRYPGRSEAVSLFIQSSRRSIAAEQLVSVVEICRQLNGLPLGIELAAGLTEHLSCEEIAQELNTGNYDLLVADQIDRPFRHRALKALLETTWQALEPAEKQHVEKLSVFRRAFSRDDALELAGVAFQDLRRLIDRSLLAYDSSGLLRMHSAVRWYAAGQLRHAPRGRAIEARLHLKVAERIRKGRGGAAPRTIDDLEPWLDAVHHMALAEQFDEACRFLIEFDIRLLLRWGQARTVLEMHQELYPFLHDEALKGRSQNSQGLALRRLGRLPEAVGCLELALEHCRKSGDLENEATYLGNLALVYSVAGNLTEAIELHLQAAKLSRSLGHLRHEGVDLGCIGLAYNRLGDTEKAIQFHERALFVSREAGDKHSEANHLGNLARIYSKQAELVHALAYVRAALALRRELNDRRGEAIDMHCLAEIHEQQNEALEAERHYRAAIALNRKIGEEIGECETQFALARFLVSQGKDQDALVCIRQALVATRHVGDQHMEGELLIWMGEQYSRFGETDSAVALWLLAQSVIPDKESHLASLVEGLLHGAEFLMTRGKIKELLLAGTSLLIEATGIGYTLPHLEVLEFSEPA